ncbi:hypothetical protein [Arsenicibacter rosenii]|uniref:Uncharacterized protein n=1 Tax=Arsenicibacter rosenii TaxID=1750698 RepID=A0A1S2VR30_9BACT|nr:hypothetical protein [Arsenicibacter rosenii]OIN61194.1 hypothetical protein BLX24_03800 [Arsenicibacter rosenii]
MEKPVELEEGITADGRTVILFQYSKWKDRNGRIFVVLDAWHGLKAYVDLLNLTTEEKIRRPRTEVERLVKDGTLTRFY